MPWTKTLEEKIEEKPEKKSLRKGSKSFQKSNKLFNQELKDKYKEFIMIEDKINFHAMYSLSVT